VWHSFLHAFRSIRYVHLLIALIILLGSFIVYGASLDSILVGVAVGLIACVIYEIWRRRPKLTAIFILLFILIFPLQRYYSVRHKENKVVVFIVDSLSNMPLEQSQEFHLFKNLTHGEVVRSLIEQNGNPYKTYLLDVDDLEGKVNTQRYKSALQRIDGFAEKYPKYQIVVNISLGSRVTNTQEESIIKSLLAKGVILVASAGNEGEERLSYPAGYSGVIAVGASEGSKRASYSNYGVEIDVLADGSFHSYDMTSVPGGSGFGSLRSKISLTGTSFATARVTGVVVRMFQLTAEREIDPEAILKNTAKPMKSHLYKQKKLGAGIVNETRAFRSVSPFYVIGVIYKASWKLALLIAIVFVSVLSDKSAYVIITKKLKHPLGKKLSITGVIIIGAGAGILFVTWSLSFVNYWSVPKEIRFFANFPVGWLLLTAGAFGATRLFGTLLGVGMAHLTILAKVSRYRLKKIPSLLWKEQELVSAENIMLRTAILKGIIESGQEGISYLTEWISQSREVQNNDKMLKMVKQFDEDHNHALTEALIRLICEGSDIGDQLDADTQEELSKKKERALEILKVL